MKKITLLILSFGLLANAVQASENIPMGLRAGFTSGPGQFHIGGHAYTGELFTGVDLTPNVEIGIGSGFTTITLNAAFTYSFTELMSPPMGFYAGGELGIIYMDHNLGSATDLGLSVLAGITKSLDNGHSGMIELKLGLIDGPDFKLTAGYTFF